METRENLTQLSEVEVEAQLLSLLTGALLGAPADIEAMHGRDPIETESIATDFIPSDKKIVLTYVGAPEASPTLYYAKTDAHDPMPFQMPDGKLKVGGTFNVTFISRSENGLVFGIGYQGQGHDYFYTNTLEDLSVKVVEKTAAEKAQNQLREVGRDINQYDYFSLMAQRYKETAERLVEAVENLPVFETDSTCRYSIDASLAGALYRLNEAEAPELIAEWTAYKGFELTKDFIGNRLAIVDGKILLIDDETNLAMGTVIAEDKHQALGFYYLNVIDTSSSDHYGLRDNSALQQSLSEKS